MESIGDDNCTETSSKNHQCLAWLGENMPNYCQLIYKQVQFVAKKIVVGQRRRQLLRYAV